MSASDRFTDNIMGQVFSPSSFVTPAQRASLRNKLDAMASGKLRDKAEAAWSAKDYALAALWEANSHKPD